MKFKRNVGIEKGRMELTPLVDVVLLLIIFFMLSSSFIFNPGIKVELPEYTASENLQPSDIVVTITKENEIYFKDEYIPLMDELRQRLKKAAAKYPDARLIIKADMNIPFRWVVQVMTIAQEEGITNQAFATRPKEIQ